MRTLILPIILLLICSCSRNMNPVTNQEIPVSSPSRWTQVLADIPIIAGRQEVALERVGSFQKMVAEHSDGRTFIIQAEESAAAPGTVLRLALYESINDSKTFTSPVNYTFRADTTIANGYSANEIVNLREWSADLRLDEIQIALIRNPLGWVIEILTYNINTFTFSVIEAVDVPDESAVSIDIALSESGPLRDDDKRNIGHGSFWVSYIETNQIDPSITPYTYLPTFYEYLLAAADSAVPRRLAQGTGSLKQLTAGGGHRGLLSIFNGGKSMYSIESFAPTSGAQADRFHLYIWQELLSSSYQLDDGLENFWLFLPLGISGTLDEDVILYNFGTWDSAYISRYNYQVQAKWIRDADPGTGWALFIGRRDQNGVFVSNLIKLVDYAGQGVTDIETELENIGIFPEVVISTDENGKVYVIFAFPDPAANSFPGTGIGFLDGDPYTTIEMMSFDGDEIYDPQNLDIRKVWEGALEPTIQSLKHISAPHRTDSGDLDISDVVLWFSMRDNVNDLRYVFYRN